VNFNRHLGIKDDIIKFIAVILLTGFFIAGLLKIIDRLALRPKNR